MSNNEQETKRKAMEDAIKKAQRVNNTGSGAIKGEPTGNQSDVRGNKSSEPSGINQDAQVTEANQQAVTGESPQSITAAQEQTAQAGQDASGNTEGISLGTFGGNQVQQQTVNAQEQIQADQAPSNNNNKKFNSKDLIKSSKETIGKANLKATERQAKHDLLARAIESTTRFERIVIKDEETGEILGTQIQYLVDKENKTVYDYAEDPDVTEHIAFVIPEEDEKNGNPVSQQVTFYWINPQY